MPRVTHFELDADNPQRAIKFYQNVFGWEVERWADQPYWLVMTGDASEPGIDGAIRPRTPGGSTTNTIEVTSVDEFLAKIVSAGGTIVEPKMTVPKVGVMAYCRDTEGNVFGIIQMDPSVT
jgi:uncharacterized protein